MRILLGNGTDVAVGAADIVEDAVRSLREPVIGLATGSTPLPLYDELVRRHREDGLSFATTHAFMLDEYVGLPDGHPEMYRTVIHRDFVARVDLDPARFHALDGLAADLDVESERFEAEIAAAGGIDLQILGIGTDGHIAFNEPGSPFHSRTRVERLTEQTRRDNARFFGGDIDAVPRKCLTQGLGTIMSARRVVLIARGEAKAHAVRQLVEGPVSTQWPASVLQRHPNVTVLVDEAAASRLERKGPLEVLGRGASAPA